MRVACPICWSPHTVCSHMYTQQPKAERVPVSGDYQRSIYKCGACYHMFSVNGDEAMLRALANVHENYGLIHYGSVKGAQKAYRQVMGLPHAQSDNTQRLLWFYDHALKSRLQEGIPSLIDVGSGLGVFPALLNKAYQVPVTLVERDRILRAHLEKFSWATVVPKLVDLIQPVDFVSAIQVLEHTANPRLLLHEMFVHLKEGGQIFLEVPSVSAYFESESEQPWHQRSEFLLDHLHVFSASSLHELAKSAGLQVYRSVGRHYRGSGKHVLLALVGKPHSE